MIAPIRWRHAPGLAAWYWSDDGGLSWYRHTDRAAPDGSRPPGEH